MKTNFEISGLIDANPQQIYDAWLNSSTHSAMTGGKAFVSNTEGDTFDAWDGYIEGRNIELVPAQKIVQHWRTSEFDVSDEDSLLEVRLEEKEGGTLITIIHSNLPQHGMQYKQGWIDNYFNPMVAYFANSK
jgi:uncharacterized protein YndB with AHSA1/START domain